MHRQSPGRDVLGKSPADPWLVSRREIPPTSLLMGRDIYICELPDRMENGRPWNYSLPTTWVLGLINGLSRATCTRWIQRLCWACSLTGQPITSARTQKTKLILNFRNGIEP